MQENFHFPTVSATASELPIKLFYSVGKTENQRQQTLDQQCVLMRTIRLNALQFTTAERKPPQVKEEEKHANQELTSATRLSFAKFPSSEFPQIGNSSTSQSQKLKFHLYHPEKPHEAPTSNTRVNIPKPHLHASRHEEASAFTRLYIHKAKFRQTHHQVPAFLR